MIILSHRGCWIQPEDKNTTSAFDRSFNNRFRPSINIVIPMAGEGSRFKNAGYAKPKPFIDVMGKPMIKW